jgi:urease accessory protein
VSVGWGEPIAVAGLHPPPLAERRWHGRLELRFQLAGNRTVLAGCRHEGPLYVQRPFYTRGDSACQVLLLHPPGGLAGGDQLEVDVGVEAGAHALITTPSAGKIYPAPTLSSVQRTLLRAAPGSRLEWIPQESIVFDGAVTESTTRIELEGDARLVAWEITCLGRPACDERFERGHVRSRIEVQHDGTPIVLERARFEGGSALLHEPFGLGGAPVFGTLVCVGPDRDESLLELLRAACDSIAPGRAACTDLGPALLCRYLGPSTEQAQRVLRSLHGLLRERCLGARALTPRIFDT